MSQAKAQEYNWKVPWVLIELFLLKQEGVLKRIYEHLVSTIGFV